jgi:5-methylthioadenosine/S-adenosylhomocysteine deaminase
VTDVWVAGRQLMNDRELTTLDTSEICANAEGWRRKLREADKEI